MSEAFGEDLSLSDMRLIRQACHNGWNIPESAFENLPKILYKIAISYEGLTEDEVHGQETGKKKESARNVNAAIRTLNEMTKFRLAQLSQMVDLGLLMPGHDRPKVVNPPLDLPTDPPPEELTNDAGNENTPE